MTQGHSTASHCRGSTLIIGASGTVGRALSSDLSRGREVVGTAFNRSGPVLVHLDIRNEEAVARTIEAHDPAVIVLCSALSNVAACESDPLGSAAINVGGVSTVAKHCRQRKLVFFSSDAVFSDARPEWSEEDPPDPRSAYGHQKTLAEEAVRECADHLILRTARVYQAERGDGKFIDFVLRTLAEGGEIQAPRGTPGNPTLVDDLSAATTRLIDRDETGTWHLAGPPVDSLFETARQVADTFKLDLAKVTPVPRDHASTLPRISARLATRKATGADLRFRSLREGLQLLHSRQRPSGRDT